jgi:hypothetical protein
MATRVRALGDRREPGVAQGAREFLEIRESYAGEGLFGVS